MTNIVVVGCGFSGSILARRIAEELGRKVLVVERRSHIGGNMYDELDEHGILVQKYGPHFLNTNNYAVIKYLKQYAELFPFCVELMSFIDGKYVQLPFNFQSVQQILGPEKAEGILARLRAAFAGRDRVPVLDIVEHPDPEVSAWGELLFEKAYRTYTGKMWGIQPEQIDKYVLDRVPMAMGYDRRYLNKDFQYLPVKGFTALFEKLLDHPNIELRLNTDALEHLELAGGKVTYDGEVVECLVYTGAIDELFGRRFGSLPYRSLDLRSEHFEKSCVLPCEIVSYPQAQGYTRSTEYRRIMYDDSQASGSTVVTEYPLDYVPGAKIGGQPYYPVVTETSKTLYAKYLEEAAACKHLFLCGRLAEFKYYNMDVCIEHALAYFEQVRACLDGKKV